MSEDSRMIDFFDSDAANQADRIYRTSVDKCASERQDMFLSNRTTDHATYILTKMFEHAESDVRLWTNGMARQKEGKQLYGNADLIHAAVSFVNKPNKRLSIIVNGPIDVDAGQSVYDHPFLGVLLEHRDAATKVRVVHVHDPNEDGHTLSVRGFAVMDESGYRAETDDGSRAVVNFGDHKVAKSLVATFDTVMSHAE